MDELLERVLGVGDQDLRANIITNFEGLNNMVRMTPKSVEHACTVIRKSHGPPEARTITPVLESRLKMLANTAKYRYVVQRPVLDYPSYTLGRMQFIWDWFTQLDDDPEDSMVKPFTEKGSKKLWFEAVNCYLSTKKGKSGYPIQYVIRPMSALPHPADFQDPGFCMPSISDELYRRGRHDGHFWIGDRREVWNLYFLKVHDTIAWGEIKIFGVNKNGRQAHVAMVARFMGQDVKRVLAKQAKEALLNLRYDNKSKNFTYPNFLARMRNAFEDGEHKSGRPRWLTCWMPSKSRP